jgi:hypothetical protein
MFAGNRLARLTIKQIFDIMGLSSNSFGSAFSGEEGTFSLP